MLAQRTQVLQPPGVLKPGPFPQLKKQRQKAERLLKIQEQGVSEQEASPYLNALALTFLSTRDGGSCRDLL